MIFCLACDLNESFKVRTPVHLAFISGGMVNWRSGYLKSFGPDFSDMLFEDGISARIAQLSDFFQHPDPTEVFFFYKVTDFGLVRGSSLLLRGLAPRSRVLHHRYARRFTSRVLRLCFWMAKEKSAWVAGCTTASVTNRPRKGAAQV